MVNPRLSKIRDEMALKYDNLSPDQNDFCAFCMGFDAGYKIMQEQNPTMIAIDRYYEVKKQLEELRQANERLVSLAKEVIDELEQYSMGRRDYVQGEKWEWVCKEIKSESDYEFYPNHVDKETIAEYRQALAAANPAPRNVEGK